jgi:hypothetical protein
MPSLLNCWPVEPCGEAVRYAGHRISYRVVGHGMPLVLVKPHRDPAVYPQVRLLSDQYRVIQIEPLGFGRSDRPRDYPTTGLHEQVLAVLDNEDVDRFIVWGYSQGAAVAAAVAQATTRAVAMIAGGFSLIDQPTDAWMRRMDREESVPVAARTFWHWYKRFNWLHEMAAMDQAALVYAGREDRAQAPGVVRSQEALTACGVTVIQFDGLDHNACNREPALSTRIAPAVTGWLDKQTYR